MPHSTIISKGQITIPITLRKRLNLKTGDKVDFRIENVELRLLPVVKTVSEVFGILESKNGKILSVDQINMRLKKSIGDKSG